MPTTYGSQSNVQAAEIAFSIYTSVDAELKNVRYPDHDWRKVVSAEQTISSINVGAQSWGAIVRDRQGTAAFQANIKGNNIPMVATSAGAITLPLQASAIGAMMTNEDARQYSMGFQGNLAEDLGGAMRQGCENLIEQTVFFGQEDIGFRGFLSYTGVSSGSAAATGTGNATYWSTKTGAQMVADVNTALSTVWQNSRSIFMPNKVCLPLSQFTLLATTPMAIGSAVTTQSALEYLKMNNICTQVTGKALEIVPIRYLAGAGAAGKDRMVVLDQDRRNQVLPFPMPYMLNQPVPVPLGAQFYAEQKFGSYGVLQLGSMYYVDGI